MAHRLCPACRASLQPLGDPICRICSIPLKQDTDMCQRCAASPPSFSQARALFSYRSADDSGANILASLIRRHKYGPNQALGAVLAGLLDEQLPMDPDYDLVMPVPLHRRRLVRRGFNQSALLAAAVTRKLRCRLDVTTLVRVIATPPQTAQDVERRSVNVHNAFAVRYPERVADLKLLLVDDVLTTGATVNECARVLRAAGALRVDVLTIARAI
jgi:ComF family protein